MMYFIYYIYLHEVIFNLDPIENSKLIFQPLYSLCVLIRNERNLLLRFNFERFKKDARANNITLGLKRVIFVTMIIECRVKLFTPGRSGVYLWNNQLR